MKSNAPFRADHVGSLLRPRELHEARADAKSGKISKDELKKVEDEHIRKVVKLQEDVGLPSITDGEFRRDWWHIDFLHGFDGVELTQPQYAKGAEFKNTDEQPPFMVISGKDPSKVDRSAAYAARYVAKNIVAAGLASKCLVQVSYAIGVAQPTSVMVTTQGTGKLSDEKLAQLVQANFDLRPKGIIQMLDLLRPIYEKTAAYGHFGREDRDFTWEATDKALALKQAA